MNPTRHSRRTDLRRAARAGAALAIAGLALAACSQAESAGNYPTKPVRIFVPYGPGGVGDLTMRVLAQRLGENVKQRFVIENKPGAGGTIAMKNVLDAPRDGYAIGEVGNGQAIATTLFTNLPYDILKDFAPVSIAGAFPVLIAVSGASPYHGLKDVVEAAKGLAGRVEKEAATADERVALCYRLALGRRPSATEAQVAREFLADSPLRELCRALLNANEFVTVE